MTTPDLADTIFLPPDDALRVWEERGELRSTVDWSEMINGEHASAFTAAKIVKLDLLAKIRTSLDDVIRNGGTFEQWKRNILPELQKTGWWGVVQNEELTGTSDAIVVDDRRLRNIYRTNLRMSIAAGRWRKFQREKELFPYLRYLSDHYRKNPRVNHESWHGIILPIDDPTWQWMFPPNGWGCNCRVRQVSEAMLRRKGWTVSEAPKADTVPFETATGEIIQVQRGVDPGFSYNPGTAHLAVLADRLTSELTKALELGLESAAETILREIIAEPAFEQFAALRNGSFPVALLSSQQQLLIGAPSRIVMLPANIYKKQIGQSPEISRGHPELTLEDYRLLPDIVERALVIARQGENRLIYFADASGRIWKAVVRFDEGRTHPAIVSFHRSGTRKIEGETKNLTVILDRR